MKKITDEQELLERYYSVMRFALAETSDDIRKDLKELNKIVMDYGNRKELDLGFVFDLE